MSYEFRKKTKMWGVYCMSILLFFCNKFNKFNMNNKFMRMNADLIYDKNTSKSALPGTYTPGWCVLHFDL